MEEEAEMTFYQWKDGEPTEQTRADAYSGDYGTLSEMVRLGLLIPHTSPTQPIDAILEAETKFYSLEMRLYGPGFKNGVPILSLWQRFIRWWRQK